jgi:hypothetical protein
LLPAKPSVRVTSGKSGDDAVLRFCPSLRPISALQWPCVACPAGPVLNCNQHQLKRQSNPAFCSAPRSTSSTLSLGTIDSCIPSLPYNFTSLLLAHTSCRSLHRASHRLSASSVPERNSPWHRNSPTRALSSPSLQLLSNPSPLLLWNAATTNLDIQAYVLPSPKSLSLQELAWANTTPKAALASPPTLLTT